MRSIASGLFVALVAVAAMPSTRAASAEDEVLAADRGYAIAYQTCNVEMARGLFADDLMFVHVDGVIENKAQYLERVRACPLDEVRSEPIKVRIHGDTAIVTAYLKFRRKGATDTGTLIYTRVWMRQSGAWRLVAHQSTTVNTPR